MSDTPKPKMEKGDKAERGAKQGAKHTENTTRQPSVNKTINPIEQLVDITETLKTIKPTSTLSPTDATEWEEVFKPELGSSDSGSDDWEIIDERDTKPCVVAAKKLLEKRQKKVESLKKLDLELAAEKSTGKGTKDGKKSVKASEEKVEDKEKRRRELKGDIKRLDRLLDEVNAENSRS